MHYIVFVLLLTCAMGTFLDDNYCNYIYNHGCRSSQNVPEIKYEGATSHRSCSIDDISDDVKFTILLAKDQTISSGIRLKVNFTLPNKECDYKVALLVNSSITNEEDCKNHTFHKTNSYVNETHSVEKRVCVLPNLSDTKENNCEKDKFAMWYTHIFTGCYALRFTVDDYKYTVRGNKFLVTDYNRTEVMEPRSRCYYYEDRSDHEPRDQFDNYFKELVTFVLGISVHADIAGMFLTLMPMSYLDETKENACVQYNGQLLHTWEIRTIGARSPLQNCSLTTEQLDNEISTRDFECNFALQVPRNASWCFKIRLKDDRCERQTIWNSPPDAQGGKPPCIWLQNCMEISKNTSVIEYNGMLGGNKQTNSGNLIWLIPIAITVIMIILIVTGIVLFVYRLHFRHSQRPVYVNTNMRNLKITRCAMEIESIETTDDETVHKSSINNEDDDDDSGAIILLYARGPTSFMSLMADFREILKTHCGCHVRDWYAACEWDAVARIGPSAWVADLLKHQHRALWIDTPRARTLFDAQWRNNYLADTRNFHDRSIIDEEAISDFRDLALPAVLDLAKRNIGPEPALQYNKHFVVRLEGFDAANKREDPFEDLSPHTRYLIPYHLSDLCSHLSSWRTNINSQQLKAETSQLRERLIRMRNNLS